LLPEALLAVHSAAAARSFSAVSSACGRHQNHWIESYRFLQVHAYVDCMPARTGKGYVRLQTEMRITMRKASAENGPCAVKESLQRRPIGFLQDLMYDCIVKPAA